MKTTYFASVLFGLLTAILGTLPMTSYATDSSRHQVVDGVDIYLGIFPAELIQGHSKQHPEGEMHGGVPVGEHRYHVTVALFDAATGKRITGAQVSARVSELGLSGTEKKLEPMTIAGAISYGNYFRMSGTGIYRIRVQVRRPGVAQAIEAEFEYQHARI
ncbi:MAG: hypothetical protein ACYC1F_08230 [Gallionellaceae bacterium]